MRATAMSGSRRTTLVAGLASAGALLLQPVLLGGFRIQPTPDMASTIVLQGPVVDVLGVVLTVVAAVVLARGVRGEPGLMRASRAAAIAVLVAAGGLVVLAVADVIVGLSLADPREPVLPAGVVIVTQVAGAIHEAALAVLAVMVVRGLLLEPLARVSLLVLALATAVSWLLYAGLGSFLPGGAWSPLMLLLVALPTVTLLASVGLAVGLVVHGRSAAMRERAEAIHRAW
ncbi:MAG: hypothetical protein HDR73_00875 [Clavibacter sp.]|uniref:Integral membrane protein n=2 Tax=Microbacteriaceae TaxID=85023 RepID=B0RAG2_CLASE|nr:hypothetical protein [Clavibacter sp.]OQJ49602.1 hypothetical protein B5P19_11365 [Clavibacter sepedonicus]OQJ54326.1 hypothetical protein B5P20_09550 [Clavibacter sepedonicus]CAQ00330.1 putative integral membrane protein [Clavibacter sepedonicus]